MPFNPASALLLIALVAAILPPGYPAYIGAYIALAAAALALASYGWRERATFTHPTALVILAAIGLVAITVPFVYRGEQDALAPVLVLPMLATIALGLLAHPAVRMPGPAIFAAICLLASLIALSGGAYEHFVLGVRRPGLGNNPIHYASLAAMAGGLALVGVAAGTTRWRYVFLLGPAFGLGASVISDSRGPMMGAIAIAGVGILLLCCWLWRERVFRFSVLVTLTVAIALAAIAIGSGNSRVGSIFESALDIFRFTGGSDDTRAALYASALEVLRTSPVFGVGLGQIMDTAQALFPERKRVFILDNLHADWANFAAMAGGLGLLAWLLLLAAPLLLLADPPSRRDRPILLGAVLLCVGQFTLGVSNATFGILPQTTLFAVALGYFLARAKTLRKVLVRHHPCVSDPQISLRSRGNARTK